MPITSRPTISPIIGGTNFPTRTPSFKPSVSPTFTGRITTIILVKPTDDKISDIEIDAIKTDIIDTFDVSPNDVTLEEEYVTMALLSGDNLDNVNIDQLAEKIASELGVNSEDVEIQVVDDNEVLMTVVSDTFEDAAQLQDTINTAEFTTEIQSDFEDISTIASDAINDR
eukprot:UN27360